MRSKSKETEKMRMCRDRPGRAGRARRGAAAAVSPSRRPLPHLTFAISAIRRAGAESESDSAKRDVTVRDVPVSARSVPPGPPPSPPSAPRRGAAPSPPAEPPPPRTELGSREGARPLLAAPGGRARPHPGRAGSHGRLPRAACRPGKRRFRPARPRHLLPPGQGRVRAQQFLAAGY